LDDWVRSYRLRALALVLATAFAEGFATSLSTPVHALVVMTLASSITLWCGLDAQVHGKLFLRSFAWLMMFTWPVGVAVHLVWTRGAKGMLTYLLLGVACIAAAGVGLGLAAVVTR
jgi:hypothetical protein